MGASWYSPSMWKLWAQSSNGNFLSQLQTTMMGENHWKQLKHHHLGFMHHPQLDQMVYIMVLDVVPAAIIASETLEGVGHIGAAVQLTTYQKELKKSWKALSQCTLGGKDYRTDIARWTCQCGSQQLQAHHLCKHLVQSMNASAGFFTELTHCQTMPIYENTLLGNSISDSKGSISAGDDFVWMGRHSDLLRGKWRSVIRRHH